MYRIVFVMMILALLMPGVASAQGPPELSFHEVYEAVQNGVVQISRGGGLGSGWRWGNVIITNYHVAFGRGNIQIWHPSIGPVDPRGKTVKDSPQPTGRPDDMWVGWDYEPEIPKGLPAQIIALDPDEDIAILLVDDLPDEIASLPMADPETIRVGDMAFLIGYPHGLWLNFNMGIVSAVQAPFSMHFPTTKVTDMFVADMWVVGGNSGGPVLNVNGEVMGLACMGIVTNFGVTPTGLNLFVNVKHVKALLDNAMAYGKFTGKFTVIPPQEEVEPCYSVSPY